MAGANPEWGGGAAPVPPPPFWGPENFIKRVKKSLHACMRIRHVLVVNSYPDHPPREFLIEAANRIFLIRRGFSEML